MVSTEAKQLVVWTLDTVEFRGLEHKMALDIATEFFDCEEKIC